MAVRRKLSYLGPVMGGRMVTRISVRVLTSLFILLRFLPTLVLILGWFVEYVDPSPVGQASVPLMERGDKGKFGQWMVNMRKPLEQRIEDKRNGIGRQKRPYIGG
jgi:hypothetical protein